MYVVERLAGFAERFRSQPLPPLVLHHAKRAVIDWYAALLPGAVVPPATLLERALAEELDRGESRLALGRRATVRAAALINGTAAHTVEVDDIFRDGIYHPGAPTIAAALALAQARGASGEAFLRAVIVGYEISTRIGAAMGRAHYKYWHNTGTIGCFGACAAAAELLAPGPKALRARARHRRHLRRRTAAGVPHGLDVEAAARRARGRSGRHRGARRAEGVTGSLDVLEGEAGYGRAMGDGPDWERALATLGEDFHITRMTFKNHACCGHTFAAIDGALALQQHMSVPAPDIERMRVGTYQAALDVAGYESPRTAAEARFSLKYVVATALTHGSVRLAAFEPARMKTRSRAS